MSEEFAKTVAELKDSGDTVGCCASGVEYHQRSRALRGVEVTEVNNNEVENNRHKLHKENGNGTITT